MDEADLSALPLEARQRFEEMRHEFVASLRGRIQEVLSQEDLVAKSKALHRLAGAAGSFGFGPLGQLAKRAEMHCEAGSASDVQALEVELVQHISQIEASY